MLILSVFYVINRNWGKISKSKSSAYFSILSNVYEDEKVKITTKDDIILCILQITKTTLCFNFFNALSQKKTDLFLYIMCVSYQIWWTTEGRCLDVSVGRAAQVQKVRSLPRLEVRNNYFSVIHIFVSCGYTEWSRWFTFTRSFQKLMHWKEFLLIGSARYYLGIPCNFSHKLKLIIPQRGRNSTKDGNTTYCSVSPQFFQYRLCTKCARLLMRVWPGCSLQQFSENEYWVWQCGEQGSLTKSSNTQAILSSEIHFISFCSQLPGFFMREFLLHNARCVFSSCLLPMVSGHHYHFSLPKVFYDLWYH